MYTVKIAVPVNRCEYYQNRIRSGWVEAASETAQEGVQLARSIVPVRTGYLRSTIYGEVLGDGVYPSIELGATARYAAYVEEGTRFMSARPYLMPAAKIATQNFIHRLQRLF